MIAAEQSFHFMEGKGWLTWTIKRTQGNVCNLSKARD